MKISGFIILAIGALVMIGGFLYDPYVRYDELQLISRKIDAQSRALDRGTKMPGDEDFPAAVYSPARAQTRELIFMGGGTLLLLGGIFAAVGSRREERTPADAPAGA